METPNIFTVLDANDFIRAYVEGIFFTESDDSGSADENKIGDAGVAEFAPETAALIVADCEAFQNDNPYIEENPTQAGHDFWFTRNRSGVGFYDRPEIYGKQEAQWLTERARTFRELSLYKGDNGLLYLE